MWGSRWLSRTCLFSLCAATTPALAQPSPLGVTSPTVTDAATLRARDLYSEGAKLFNDGKFEQARVAFAAAYAIKPHPENARALADCEWALQRWRDAAEHFAVYFGVPGGPGEDARAKLARERFAAVRSRIGVAHVTVSPSSAFVTLNGVVRRAANVPPELFVDPGDLAVEASADGFESQSKRVPVAAGQVLDVRIDLAPTRPRTSFHAPPSSSAWRPPVGLLVGTSVLSVVGLGAGIGLAVAATGKAGSANRLDATFPSDAACARTSPEGRCAELREAWGAQDALSNAAVGALVAGGILGVATGGLLVWRGSVPTQVVDMTPVASPGGGAVIMRGRW